MWRGRDSTNGRDRADGGVSGGLDQPAPGGRDRLENQIIEPEFGSPVEGELQRRQRLGGLLRYDYRDAA